MDAAAQLFELMQCLCRVARSEQRARGGGEQLQPVHLEALAYLERANRYSNTPQALTEYLGSTKGTVSQSLLLLYRRGLIERQPDAKDRRVVRLGLSAAGHRLLESPGLGEDWLQAVAGLPPAQVETAVAVLSAALLRLQRQRGGRSFGVCRSCRMFRVDGPQAFRCGLTGEPLSQADATRICREHEPAGDAG
jgi:DNA-binding MarR family transcriptional regulator